MSGPIEIKTISANGYIFKVRCLGSPDLPAIIFLHGWPETSFMWEAAMQHFHKLGFYCIAPDQRGYSSGARPKSIKSYFIDHLIEDVRSLSNKLGLERFHLVAHDWGAEVGWKYIETYPEAIISFNALAVPHGSAFRKAIEADKTQRKKSWYMGFFQIPGIPEWSLKSANFKRLRSVWTHQSEEEVEEYIEHFKEKGALTASINWYRANINFFKQPKSNRIRQKYTGPVMLIYGNQDVAVTKTAVEFNEKDASHWLIQEKPDEVLQLLQEHISKHTH